MEFLQLFQNALPAYTLIAFRASGLFLTAPIFGQQRLPQTVKVLFALILAALIAPHIAHGPLPQDSFNYLVMALLELITGIIYGWSASLIFEGVILAGQFIGLQMGFAQANILNPVSNTQRPLLSELYFLMTLFLFFAIDGHHLFILAFSKSYQAVPLGHFVFNELVLQRIFYLFSQIFVVALIIAAPINGVLTLIDLLMGLIARTAPQMNVLILSFAIKIYIGILTLLFSLSFTFYFIRDLLQRLSEHLVHILG